ncbi:MAG: glycoside hydrolase family 3 protein [Erysipelotrichaceae bacterium]|nr:glycoside hydrolase family 3 protein [Erysipelotrichaceae bacterium]
MMMKQTKAIFGAVIFSLLLSGCGRNPSASSAVPQDTEAVSSTSPSAVPSASSSAETDTISERVNASLAKMDLHTKIEQMMVPAIRTWNGSNFISMNDETAALLQQYHFGGIILFAENMTSDSSQAIQLTQSLQANAIAGGGLPLFIGTDQESGNVYRLLSGTVMPSSMALAATGDPQNAYKTGQITSKELKALGFNLDYAPDMDVNTNPNNPVIGIRSYSDDSAIVAEYAHQFTMGMKENDIIATGKHFPGHGDTATDSHTGLPQVNKTKAELENTDLIPFKQAVQDGTEMIMSAHIQYPQIETETYTSIKDGREVYLPSTLSHVMITDILRNELGFDGVVTTDSLQMNAIKDNFSTSDAAELAINAGVDCLLMPVDISDASAYAQLDAYIQSIADMVNTGAISIDMINEAVTRILALKYKRGIMDTAYGDAHTASLLNNADALVGTAENYAIDRTISDQAATLLQNDSQIIPFTVPEGAKITVLTPNSQQAGICGYTFNRLTDEGVVTANATGWMISEEYGSKFQAASNAIAGSSLVIVTSLMLNGSDIDFNRSSEVYNMCVLIERAKAQGIPVIAVSTGLPYDAPLLAEADAVLCTYDWVGAPRVDANWVPTQAYSESLAGAMDVIFGKVKASGKLPVNIFSINNGSITSDILWPRGYAVQ